MFFGLKINHYECFFKSTIFSAILPSQLVPVKVKRASKVLAPKSDSEKLVKSESLTTDNDDGIQVKNITTCKILGQYINFLLEIILRYFTAFDKLLLTIL
jgi:hypothetical protein